MLLKKNHFIFVGFIFLNILLVFYNITSFINISHLSSLSNISNRLTHLSHFASDPDREVIINTKLKTRQITYNNNNGWHVSGPTVLILSLIGSKDSYGYQRTFGEYFEMISNISYPIERISIGLLIPEYEEFVHIDNVISEYYNDTNNTKFQSIKLINANFLEDETTNREDRHDPKQQLKRRSIIAKSRNYLFTSAIENEDYTLWIDNDISGIPHDLIDSFISHGKDITTIRIVDQDTKDYDLNSWVGPRKVPSDKQYEKIKNKKTNNYQYIPKDVKSETKHLSDYSNEIIKLNSVGSAILFIKSEIHKQGILFSPFYIIGIKNWEFWDGYDGIESESLCFQAEKLGYECFGLPNLTAFHQS